MLYNRRSGMASRTRPVGNAPGFGPPHATRVATVEAGHGQSPSWSATSCCSADRRRCGRSWTRADTTAAPGPWARAPTGGGSRAKVPDPARRVRRRRSSSSHLTAISGLVSGPILAIPVAARRTQIPLTIDSNYHRW